MDEAFAITMQQMELARHKKTRREESPYSFNINGGSRILFLDGGGIRGLIQIEILEQLEKKTGRKVTELFDWIVGTSTGGIVALGLVYGMFSSCCFLLFKGSPPYPSSFSNKIIVVVSTFILWVSIHGNRHV